MADIVDLCLQTEEKTKGQRTDSMVSHSSSSVMEVGAGGKENVSSANQPRVKIEGNWKDGEDSDVDVVEEVELESQFKKEEEKDDVDDDQELKVVGTKGESVSDWPHARSDCLKFQFRSGDHQKHCEKCMCYVCEVVVSECVNWSRHCNASGMLNSWTNERKKFQAFRAKYGRPMNVEDFNQMNRMVVLATKKGETNLPPGLSSSEFMKYDTGVKYVAYVRSLVAQFANLYICYGGLAFTRNLTKNGFLEELRVQRGGGTMNTYPKNFRVLSGPVFDELHWQMYSHICSIWDSSSDSESNEATKLLVRTKLSELEFANQRDENTELDVPGRFYLVAEFPKLEFEISAEPLSVYLMNSVMTSILNEVDDLQVLKERFFRMSMNQFGLENVENVFKTLLGERPTVESLLNFFSIFSSTHSTLKHALKRLCAIKETISNRVVMDCLLNEVQKDNGLFRISADAKLVGDGKAKRGIMEVGFRVYMRCGNDGRATLVKILAAQRFPDLYHREIVMSALEDPPEDLDTFDQDPRAYKRRSEDTICHSFPFSSWYSDNSEYEAENDSNKDYESCTEEETDDELEIDEPEVSEVEEETYEVVPQDSDSKDLVELKVPEGELREPWGVTGEISLLGDCGEELRSFQLFRRALISIQNHDFVPASLNGFLRELEHSGYSMQDCAELEVQLRPYQQQDLKWMLDQERGAGGINAAFLEKIVVTDVFVEEQEAEDISPYEDDFPSFVSKRSDKPKTMYVNLFAPIGKLEEDMYKPLRGGILADEMGLGKTIVTLALVLENRATSDWLSCSVPDPDIIRSDMEVIEKLTTDNFRDFQSGFLNTLTRQGCDSDRFQEIKKLFETEMKTKMPSGDTSFKLRNLCYQLYTCFSHGYAPRTLEDLSRIAFQNDQLLVELGLRSSTKETRLSEELRPVLNSFANDCLSTMKSLYDQHGFDYEKFPFQTKSDVVDRLAKQRTESRVRVKGTLVVCHVSLVAQWVEEARKKSNNRLSILEYYGGNRNRCLDKIDRFDIVVTTYAILASDFKHRGPGQKYAIKSKADIFTWMPPLEKFHWHRVVLDESHTLRNSSATQALACFRLVAQYRWCVTGTPFSNGFLDIFGQLKFLRANPLNSKALLESVWQTPLIRRIAMKAVMIRHSKRQILNGQVILDLPGKTETKLIVPFTDEERQNYMALLKEKKSIYLEKRCETVLNFYAIVRPLRQFCVMGNGFSTEQRNEEGSSTSTSPSKRRRLEAEGESTQFEVARAEEFSKVKKLVEMVRNNVNEDQSKVLVFTEFLGALSAVVRAFQNAGIGAISLESHMDSSHRSSVLERFKNDSAYSVLCTTYKTAAVGINLTAANHVYLLNPCFNPALEYQAIGRVHRLGQSRPVHVTRLIMESSVEKTILQRRHDAHQTQSSSSRFASSVSNGKGRLYFDEETETFERKHKEISGGGVYRVNSKMKMSHSTKFEVAAYSSRVLARKYQTDRQLKLEDFDAMLGVTREDINQRPSTSQPSQNPPKVEPQP